MLIQVVKLLKKYPILLYSASFLYSLIHNRYYLSFVFRKDIICKGVFFNNTQIGGRSRNKYIEILPKTQLKNCVLTAEGDSSSIIIGGAGSVIKNSAFHTLDAESCIEIQDGFTTEGVWIMATEGHSIKIGEDCMFSSGISIINGDSHAIFLNDDSHKRINPASDIVIGKHVWICSDVKVLKGSNIPSYSIIGANSVVNKYLSTEYAMYVGCPARQIKSNVDWSRSLTC